MAMAEQPPQLPRAENETTPVQGDINELIRQTQYEIIALTPEVMRALDAIDSIGGSRESHYKISNDIMNVVGVLTGIKPAALIDSNNVDKNSSR